MKQPIRKVSRSVCYVDQIFEDLEGKLKRAAELQPADSSAAVAGYQKLLDTRRARSLHGDRCAICQRLAKQAAALTPQELNKLGDDIGELFEQEAMRVARQECADRHGDLTANESEAA